MSVTATQATVECGHGDGLDTIVNHHGKVQRLWLCKECREVFKGMLNSSVVYVMEERGQ